MSNFKYIKNMVSGGEGTILIYKEIGNSIDKNGNRSYGVNGSDFASEMQYLQERCSNITVRINSIGGSVLDGYAITSSIYNCKVPVNTCIDGLAASTALWCAMAAPVGNRKAMDYSTGMIHESSGTDNEVVKNIIDNSINTILSNRCNLKAEDIKSMMEQETWLDCATMIKHGIIDEVVSTNKKIKSTKNLAEMANVYNKLINNESEMTNEQIQAVEAENKNLKAEVESLKADLKTFKDAKDAAELAAKNQLKSDATALVNKAFESGKIVKDEVESTINSASASVENFKMVSNFLEKLPSKKISSKPFDPKNVKEEKDETDRTNWTYNEWEQKDEAGLKNLYLTNKAQYDELLKTRVVKIKK